MKKVIISVAFLAAALIFILTPVKPADLLLRLSMNGTDVEHTYLYYSTTDTPGFNGEMCIQIQKTDKDGLWEFRIPASEARKLKAIRLDVAGSGNDYTVSDVSVSSGGVTVKTYNAGVFFAPGNVGAYTDLTYGNIADTSVVGIYASGGDPYFVFTDTMGDTLRHCVSYYRITRLLIVLFISGAYWIYRMKPFEK